MIQTRSHLKQSLFSSADLFSTSSDYITSSNFFPSPRKLPPSTLPLEFNNNRLRKSSTSLQSSQTLKTKKSFSSETRSKLQQSTILKKVQILTFNNDNITLREKEEVIETYQKRVRDLKSKKAKLGEEVKNKQMSQLKKARGLRMEIGKYFGRE